jgi:hypothetical protein
VRSALPTCGAGQSDPRSPKPLVLRRTSAAVALVLLASAAWVAGRPAVSPDDVGRAVIDGVGGAGPWTTSLRPLVSCRGCCPCCSPPDASLTHHASRVVSVPGCFRPGRQESQRRAAPRARAANPRSPASRSSRGPAHDEELDLRADRESEPVDVEESLPIWTCPLDDASDGGADRVKCRPADAGSVLCRDRHAGDDAASTSGIS